MFQFVVARSLGGSIAAIRERVEARFVPSLTFRPAVVEVHVAAGGLVVVAAHGTHDTDGTIDGGVAVDDDHVLLYCGQPAVPSSGGRAATALLADVRASSLDDVVGRLGGHVGIVLVHRATGRIRATTDANGFQPLFVLRGGGVVGVSNRQRLLDVVSRGGTRLDLDPEVMADLLWQANLVSGAGAVRGTELVRAGETWEVDRDGTDRSLVRAGGGTDGGPVTADDWDRVSASLVEGTRHLVDRPVDVTLSLTGGRDSRLVLGLVVAAGAAGDLTTFTTGPGDHPDVVDARRVAEAAGVEHSHEVAQVRTDLGMWEALEAHPWRMDASICPWDGLGLTSTSREQVELAGLGGELYRVNARRWTTLDLEGPDDLATALRDWQQPADPLSLLRPAVRARQDAALRRRVEGWRAAGTQLTDVEATMFRRVRLPLWSGIINNVRFPRRRAFPLLHPWGPGLVGAGRFEHRRADLFHGEVMARVAPALYRLPFGDVPWSEMVRGRHPAPTTTVPLPPARSDTQGQMAFVRRNLDPLLDVVLSSPSSDLFEVVDRVALASFARDQVVPPGTPGTKAVLSLVGMQIALTTGGSPTYDGVAEPEDLRVVAPEGWESAIRRSWPGRGADPRIVLATRVQRSERRRAAVALVDGVPAQDVEEVVAGGRPLSDLVPRVVVDLPAGRVAGLRIDPRRGAGAVVVGPVAIRRHDRPDEPVGISEFTIVHAVATGAGPERLHLDCADDPRLVLSRVPDALGGGNCQVVVGLVADDDVVLQCFWDDGSGFSEDRKVSVTVPAHPLAALVTQRRGTRTD